MIVRPHTSLKHRTLGVYFLICRQVMRRMKLYYADLYAGDGECECDEAPIKRWDPPLIASLLEPAKKGKMNLTCFINDIEKGNIEKLKLKVNKYSDFIKSITQEDANVVYKEILNQISPKEWSIFFLDPCNHSQLDWTTIENISKHEAEDKINDCIRKPELIINLMTYTMQRSIQADPASITKALGTDEWKEKITENQSEEKMYEIFSDIFIKRLEELGYFTTYFFIKQTPPNQNILYYLIFASSIPRAHEIISTRFKPYIDKITKEKWVRENFKYRMINRAEKEGFKTLNHYY